MKTIDNLADRLAGRFGMKKEDLGRTLATLIHISILILPNIFVVNLPFEPQYATKLAYQTVENLTPGSYVLCDFNNLNPSNFEAEVGWRGIAALNHLHVKGMKLVIYGAANAFPMFWEFFKHWQLGVYNPATNPKYGRDWVFLRSFPMQMDWFLRFISYGWDVSQFPEMRFDDGGRDVTQMPIYWKDGIVGGERAIKNIFDVKCVYVCDPGPTFGQYRETWKLSIPYPDLKIIFGCPVVATFQESQWLPDIWNGFLAGLRGAGEYETLTSAKYGSTLFGPASGALASVSIGLMWYVVTIAYLNIDEYIKKRKVMS